MMRPAPRLESRRRRQTRRSRPPEFPSHRHRTIAASVSSADLDGCFRAVALYYDDIVLSEPRMIEMYDALLTKLDRALGE